MFLCLVLVGDTVVLRPGKYLLPPFKNGVSGERYDSITNGGINNTEHFIIYDNCKSYPAYLITY